MQVVTKTCESYDLNPNDLKLISIVYDKIHSVFWVFSSLYGFRATNTYVFMGFFFVVPRSYTISQISIKELVQHYI